MDPKVTLHKLQTGKLSYIPQFSFITYINARATNFSNVHIFTK
jgi:hypothetical protein